MTAPVIDIPAIRIQDGGDLLKGLYFYSLVSVDEDGAESLSHIIQVYIPHHGCIVSLSWDKDPAASYYRLYRGTGYEDYEGYFNIWGCEFNDDGFGVLNEI